MRFLRTHFYRPPLVAASILSKVKWKFQNKIKSFAYPKQGEKSQDFFIDMKEDIDIDPKKAPTGILFHLNIKN